MKKLFIVIFALPILLAAACFTSCEPGNNPSNPGDVQMVDLGLSVKWANMNVGATCGTTVESWYGDYFAWGLTKPQERYDWDRYAWSNSAYQIKYCTDAQYGEVDDKTTLEAADDAATANWGGKWRMPTKAEQEELREKCTWVWVYDYHGINGLKGYVVTATNGNSIFLPAAGYRIDSSVYDAGSEGWYWSSSLSEDGSIYACYLNINSDDVRGAYNERCSGLSVRPVCE